MGSIRSFESIAKLVKTSATVVSLPASCLNIGPAQFRTTSALTCTISVSGVGGIDTGSIAANQIYYAYAVVSSNQVYLICSLSSSLPTGYTAARKVGAFTTNASSQIQEYFSYGQSTAVSEWASFTPTGTWSTNTTYTGKYRRVGDSVQVQVKVAVSGAPTNNYLTVDLTSLGIGGVDTSKMATSGIFEQTFGKAFLNDSSPGTTYNYNVLYRNGNAIQVDGINNNTTPFTWASGDFVTLEAIMPMLAYAGISTIAW